MKRKYKMNRAELNEYITRLAIKKINENGYHLVKKNKMNEDIYDDEWLSNHDNDSAVYPQDWAEEFENYKAEHNLSVALQFDPQTSQLSFNGETMTVDLMSSVEENLTEFKNQIESSNSSVSECSCKRSKRNNCKMNESDLPNDPNQMQGQMQNGQENLNQAPIYQIWAKMDQKERKDFLTNALVHGELSLDDAADCYDTKTIDNFFEILLYEYSASDLWDLLSGKQQEDIEQLIEDMYEPDPDARYD